MRIVRPYLTYEMTKLESSCSYHVVSRQLAVDLEVRLERLDVLDEQLRPRLGEEVERRQARHDARVGAQRRPLPPLHVRLLTLL